MNPNSSHANALQPTHVTLGNGVSCTLCCVNACGGGGKPCTRDCSRGKTLPLCAKCCAKFMKTPLVSGEVF